MLRMMTAGESHGPGLTVIVDGLPADLPVDTATIDRMLGPTKVAAAGGRRRRAGFHSAIRREVPIRTFNDWNDPPPGFLEVDMVAHGGTSVAGSFIQTLTMVDVATGWTECLPPRQPRRQPRRGRLEAGPKFVAVAHARLCFQDVGDSADDIPPGLRAALMERRCGVTEQSRYTTGPTFRPSHRPPTAALARCYQLRHSFRYRHAGMLGQ